MTALSFGCRVISASKVNIDADAAARFARQFPDVGFKIPYTDFKQQINTFITSRWQLAWDSENQNKLHSIQPRVGTCVSVSGLSRREERVLHRARIGHTYLTHSYHLKREDPPICIPCQVPLTVEHILISCIDFNHVRIKHFQAATLCDLFNSVPIRTILDFIKEIGLLHKL